MAKKRGSASTGARAKPTGKLTAKDKSEQYRKIPGDPARRYEKVGGRKVLSRRQYDALRSREGAAKAAPPRQFSKEATTRYWRFVRSWKASQMPGASNRAVSKDAGFKERYHQFVKSKDNSASGPRARFLVDIGWRNPGARYRVGETPKKFRGGRRAA